jgi:hypothetical protein
MWLGEVLARLSSDPTRCYASANRRSGQATYAAVCSKRATPLGNVQRANRKPPCGGNRPSGWMPSVQRLDVKLPDLGHGDIIEIPLSNIVD